MRPDRIIIGECRGGEVLDMLQAMNTGHEGSMTTVHANTPRECISRMESMILMGGYDLPAKTIREMIVNSVDVIVQAARLRDGSRKVTHVTDVVGLEGEVVILQDLLIHEVLGEDAGGRLREASLDRYRSAALLGEGLLLRGRKPSGPGSHCGRSARRARRPLGERFAKS